ncbi:MAG: transporter substrate-binding domain-containing protein [Bacteroidota bacterium]
MRKIIYLGIIFFTFMACSGPKDEPTQAEEEYSVPPVDLDLAEIIERGYINAAIDQNSTSYFIYKGELMGFEYELLKRFENFLDVKVNIIVQPSIEASFRMLNRGEVDIVAYPLTITKSRKKIIAFTDHYITQRQVLVQRKPKNWRKMKLHEIEKVLIRDQVDLIDEEIHVLSHSSYVDALESLSEQIGGDITAIEADPALDSEQLIEQVADGRINYTVSDENIAYVNRSYYPNVDIKTYVSFPRRIAWAVRMNAPHLRDTLNYGINRIRKNGIIKVTYDKYFRSTRKSREIAKSDFASFTGKKFSPYDDLIKENAAKLKWDWRLLAAMIYQESRFNPKTTSWAGAQGLLQMMPASAKRFGVNDRTNPEQNLRGGTEYLMWLENLWQQRVESPDERLKFIMASYNVGIGHVYDACALTEKNGGNPARWNDVKAYLINLAHRQYYSDPVVKLGYARGSEPVNYVDNILELFERYKQLIPEN